MINTYDAITVWQPWATLIMEGLKPWEFRGWPKPPNVSGRIAIHAGARAVRKPELQDLIYRLEQGGKLAKSTGLIKHEVVLPLLHQWLNAPQSLPLKCVLGTVVMTKAIRTNALAGTLGLDELVVNDSTRNEKAMWAWPCSSPIRFEPPVPASGSQGFWMFQHDEVA